MKEENKEVKTDENVQKYDRIAEIAKEKMEEINKSKEAKDKDLNEKKEESKDASSDSSPEKEKIEDKNTDKTDDTNSKETDKKKSDKKEEEKAEESEVDKVRKAMQSRIDELTGKFKSTEHARKKDSEEIEKLRKQINELQEVTKETVEESYERMIEEDKDKPLDQRREMSEADLENFLLDDYSKAQQWLVRRELRREKELSKVEDEKKSKEDTKEKSEKFVEKTTNSMKELLTKYPKLDVTTRAEELVKEGKSHDEITKIIRSENKDFDLMMEIVSENEKYSDSESGPGLVLEEMNKRKSNVKQEVKTYTAEEIEAIKKEAAEVERQRISSIDEGSSSNFGGPINSSSNNDPMYQKGLSEYMKAMKKAGLNKTEADYKERLRYRERIPGSKTYKD